MCLGKSEGPIEPVKFGLLAGAGWLPPPCSAIFVS